MTTLESIRGTLSRIVAIWLVADQDEEESSAVDRPPYPIATVRLDAFSIQQYPGLAPCDNWDSEIYENTAMVARCGAADQDDDGEGTPR